MEISSLQCDRDADQQSEFEELYRHYRKIIFPKIQLLVRNFHDAEDLFHETMIRYYRHRHRLSSDIHIPWLCRVARNRCMSYFHRNNRPHRLLRKLHPLKKIPMDPEINLPLDEDEIDVPDDDMDFLERIHDYRSIAVGQAVERVDEASKVHRAIDSLSAYHALLISMVDVWGFSHDRAASTLHKPIATIRSALFRARLALRCCLENEELCLSHRPSYTPLYDDQAHEASGGRYAREDACA